MLARPPLVSKNRQDAATETTTTTAEKLAHTPEAAPSFPEMFDDLPPGLPTDWSRSYHGLSTQAFAKDIVEVLLAPLDPLDIEIKPGSFSRVSLYLSLVEWTPDGILYLPEIKYRRVLNKAFGPGGWGLAPRSETHVGPKIVSREYALVCQGRCVMLYRIGMVLSHNRALR